jgi:hypothetical protein
MAKSMDGDPPDIVGLQATGDELETQAFKGAHYRTTNAPESVTPSGNATITATLHYDNLGRVISPIPVRGKLESPALRSPKYTREYNLTHCQTRPVSLDLPITGSPGQTIAATLKAQNKTAIGWQTTDTVGPLRIDIVSEGDKFNQELLNYAPYAGVGGAAGGLLSDNGTSGALLGAVAGAGGKYILDNSNAEVIPDPGGLQFPTLPVVAGAGLLIGGALFLGQAQDYVPPEAIRRPISEISDAASGAVDTVDVTDQQ